MANDEHAMQLGKGVASWNAWRRSEFIAPDLSDLSLVNTDLTNANLADTDLSGASLSGVNLARVDLRDSNLSNSVLTNVTLTDADMSGARLTHARLERARLINTKLISAMLEGATFFDADLGGADLTCASFKDASFRSSFLVGAKLEGSYLSMATFADTELSKADFTEASLSETVMINTNLSQVIGLDTCRYYGASTVDLRTLQLSDPLPLQFLRGVGLPETFIQYLPALLNQSIQHYSCFISYSSKDRNFAERLHADLQDKGVRCWFAPHDMPIGGKILDEIDAAIRLRDKVLLILSEHSIESDWVEDEVTKAFEEERTHKKIALFPIRLDDTVMDTNEAWAAKLRAQRNIGDFRRWEEHDEYQKSFARVLRDLTVKKP
jgi:uncharacterized protein YjbI with pentapeptide repeats